MKLLLVFVSALVLVVHGNVTPSEEEESVYEIKPEVVAGDAVDAGQEADGLEEPAADPETDVYIPIVSRACNNAGCANACHRLGFKVGVCISPTACWCHN